MPKIIRIAQREYLETVKTKTFILGILMAPAIIAGIIFFTGRMSRGRGAQPPLRLELIDLSGQVRAEIRDAVTQHNNSHVNRQIHLRESSPDPNQQATEISGKNRLRHGKTDALVVIDRDVVEGAGKIHIYTHKPKASSLTMLGNAESLMRRAVVNQRCRAQDIPSELLAKIRSVPVENVEVGKAEGQQKVQRQSDKIMKMMVPFFFMYLMFMGMVGTGQHMVSSVIEEKGSRVIEVLLSAVSPFELMAGKILGLCAIGITVVCIWGTAAYSAAQYKGFEIELSGPMLAYFAVYFLLGFLLFTSVLAGVGSICNTIKETQGLMMPIMLIFILPLLAWMKLVQEPDGTLARVLSFVPPITPMVMILRISASDSIPLLEIVASMVVLGAGVLITMWGAAKVFRTGILMYGKRPGLREIYRWLRQA